MPVDHLLRCVGVVVEPRGTDSRLEFLDFGLTLRDPAFQFRDPLVQGIGRSLFFLSIRVELFPLIAGEVWTGFGLRTAGVGMRVAGGLRTPGFGLRGALGSGLRVAGFGLRTGSSSRARSDIGCGARSPSTGARSLRSMLLAP